jgi:hypothetical protein
MRTRDRLDAPATALLTNQRLTEVEAHVLERDLAKVGREYGRAVARVRRLKADLRKAEETVRGLRRTMRLLISARRSES